MDGLPPNLKPLDTKALARESREILARSIKDMRNRGIPDDVIIQKLGAPAAAALGIQAEQPGEVPRELQQPPAGPTAPLPDMGLPDTFNPNALQPKLGASDDESSGPTKHPLLTKLEHAFGIKRLKCREDKLGPFRWRFRPADYSSYEWASGNVDADEMGSVLQSQLQSVTVCSVLAAIDGVPVYEVMGIDTTGRYIPDPNYPPQDIRDLASQLLLDWFRAELGLWELVPELDKLNDHLFAEVRSTAYPTLREPSKSEATSTVEPGGKAGDAASPNSDGSQQSSAPTLSGTTPSAKSGSSTGPTSNDEKTDETS